MQKLALFVMLLVFSLEGYSQSIRFAETSIKADGILDESIWDEIIPFNGFSNYYPINGGKTDLDTDVKIYHDGKYLNVAFIYHDTLSRVKVNGMKRDKYVSSFHLSDCVGLIIDPYGNQNRGYFFAVNGKGTQLDALIANYNKQNLSWDALWESGQSVDGADKIYEMKIPLSTFSYSEDVSEWSFQFYTRDSKNAVYTVWNQFEGGFFQFDTRFLKSIEIEDLVPSKSNRLLLIPALTANFRKDVRENKDASSLKPSLDVQYKVSDGLRLDLTINPDFSQVEVDQQVTNLTRFQIVFPEKRVFFTENSDIFTTLGAASNITPFNSRFIGATQDILMGLKLSGNVLPNTRVGLLNVQSAKNDFSRAQNYTVATVKQQLSKIFNAKAYLVNRQATEGYELRNDYNRVIGTKAGYLSKNRKWSGLVAYSHSLKNNVSTDRSSFYAENKFSTQKLSMGSSIHSVGKNYYTDIGFVPRIRHFDALNKMTIREGYTQFHQDFRLFYFTKKSRKYVERYRPVLLKYDVFFDESGRRTESRYYYNGAVWFRNQMSIFMNLYHDDIHLKYAFDPLRNGKAILPGDYQNSSIRLGWNSNYTKKVYWAVNIQSGSFYQGTRKRFGLTTGYRLLPFFTAEVKYEYNNLNFTDLGENNLHLLGLTTEVFFSNKLNWTTYIQQNEQIDNFNINSRLKWEYKPLSFAYLVFSDNYSNELAHKNWSVSIKVNKRLYVNRVAARH